MRMMALLSHNKGEAQNMHFATQIKFMSNSHDHQLEELKPYILTLMRQEGRDFAWCEYKQHPIVDGKYEIHHTKYDGATYKDLMIVCRSCNRLAENKGLA